MNHLPYRPMGLLHFTSQYGTKAVDLCAIKFVMTDRDEQTKIEFWDGSYDIARESFAKIIARYEGALKADPSPS